MDYHLFWYKCCPHWDNVQWPWLGSIPQRSRSHETFNGQSTHARVCAITNICIDGFPSNLVQMLSLVRRCAYIQEYLGYQSNNLHFLFSHSWPVVVYNFGQCSLFTYNIIKICFDNQDVYTNISWKNKPTQMGENSCKIT